MPNSAQLAASVSICLAEIGVGQRQVEADGRRVVVHGGQGEVGPADGAAGQAQAVERLGRGDLVDEMEVDVEQVGLAVGRVDDVALPHLVGHCLLSHILRR